MEAEREDWSPSVYKVPGFILRVNIMQNEGSGIP